MIGDPLQDRTVQHSGKEITPEQLLANVPVTGIYHWLNSSIFTAKFSAILSSLPGVTIEEEGKRKRPDHCRIHTLVQSRPRESTPFRRIFLTRSTHEMRGTVGPGVC
jgi:hypothetical protein